MDQSKSSFIPKKPLSSSHQKKRKQAQRGWFYNTTFAIFILSVVAVGGIFGYSKLLSRQIDDMRPELEEAASTLESPTIQQYKVLDERIKSAEDVVSEHHITSVAFDRLSEVTLQTVQFTEFGLAFAERETGSGTQTGAGPTDSADADSSSTQQSGPQRDISVELAGEANSFETVAVQARNFQESDFFENVRVYDLSVSQESGRITFAVSALLDLNQIDFRTTIGQNGQSVQVSEEASAESASTSTGTPVEETVTAITTDLTQTIIEAEELLNETGSFTGTCDLASIEAAFTEDPSLENACIEGDGGEQWVAWVELPEEVTVGDQAFCVDSSGFTSAVPMPAGQISACTDVTS